MTGLAFKVEREFNFDKWLRCFLHDIRAVRGVISELKKKGRPSFPPDARTFQHSKPKKRKGKLAGQDPTKSEDEPTERRADGELAARQALLKAGVVL